MYTISQTMNIQGCLFNASGKTFVPQKKVIYLMLYITLDQQLTFRNGRKLAFYSETNNQEQNHELD